MGAPYMIAMAFYDSLMMANCYSVTVLPFPKLQGAQLLTSELVFGREPGLVRTSCLE